MQKLLITNNHLHDVKGSELVTLEIAAAFLKMGWHVTIYTNLYLPPLSNEVARLPFQENLYIPQNPCDEFTPDFDIIWIQQNTIPPSVIRALSLGGLNSYIIWHHMSPFIHIELPLMAEIENQLCDVITAVSQETAERITEFGVDARKIMIFDNPAPDEFSLYPPRVLAVNKPAKLLVVTNHLPQEVKEAIPLLIEKGILVTHLGDGSQVKRLTPELLSGYDAVLTIGKTVQYAVSMGIPVYEYDYMGGYGWLHEGNFLSAAEKNFSGRASREKKKPSEIVRDITEKYILAREFAQNNASILASKYLLSNQLSRILQQLSSSPPLKKLTPQQALRVNAFNELNRGLYRTLMYFKNMHKDV